MNAFVKQLYRDIKQIKKDFGGEADAESVADSLMRSTRFSYELQLAVERVLELEDDPKKAAKKLAKRFGLK